jgi:transcriptional regulator with XRE-family HTH domain
MTPEQMQAVRAALDFDYEKFGRLVGVTGRAIYRYERGERKIPQSVINVLFVFGMLDRTTRRVIAAHMTTNLDRTVIPTGGAWL